MDQDTLAYQALSGFASAPAGCALCQSLREEEEPFFAGAGSRSESVESVAEAVVDALGFCGYHGVLLTTRRDSERAITYALRDATERAIDLLREEKRNAERLLEIFFNAERSCASCRASDHRLAHHTRRVAERVGSERPTSLCSPHYRAITYAARGQMLLELVTSQRSLLETVVGVIGAIGSGPHARAYYSSLAPETLRWALDVVACSMPPHRDEREPWAAAKPACPVCTEIARAAERWVDAVRASARLGQDLWTVFPTCPAHIQHCAALGDERVAVLAVRYAADVQLAALRRGMAALAGDNEQRAAAAKSVFYRRKSPTYVLGQQRKMIADAPHCPACERLIVARDRAIGSLVQRIRGGQFRSGDAPCLKHFAAAYVLVPNGRNREVFVAGQLEVLEGLRGKLENAIAVSGSGTDVFRGAVREGVRVWSSATPPRSA